MSAASKVWYDALRKADINAYHKAIAYAEGLSLTYNWPEKQAIECERSHIMFACELLGVKP